MARAPYLAAALLFVSLAADTATALAAMTTGAGAAKCADWTIHRRLSNPKRSEEDQQWILGFLAGMRFVQMPNAPPRAVNAEDFWQFVDDYCDQNPSDRLQGAAVYFYRNHAR